MNDQIVSVSWLDAHQTAAAFSTKSGKQFVLPKRFLPKGLEAAPCYTVRSARYANEDHTAIIARTNEAGDVALSQIDTPALWDYVLATIKVAPFAEPAADKPSVAHYEPPAEPQQEQSWMAGLLRRMDVPEHHDLPEPAQPQAPEVTLQEFVQSMQSQQAQFTAAMDDAARRKAAKQLVADAVLKAAQRVTKDQVRFEVAMEAKNGRVDSVSMLEEEAKAKGVGVGLLAEQIVVERRALERRMMWVHGVERRAIVDIDGASGDTIDAIASVAAADIIGEH